MHYEFIIRTWSLGAQNAKDAKLQNAKDHMEPLISISAAICVTSIHAYILLNYFPQDAVLRLSARHQIILEHYVASEGLSLDRKTMMCVASKFFWNVRTMEW